MQSRSFASHDWLAFIERENNGELHRVENALFNAGADEIVELKISQTLR